MGAIWNFIKENSVPLLFGPVKYKDMSEHMKDAAIADVIARVLLTALIPLAISLLVPLIITVQYGLWINTAILFVFGRSNDSSLNTRIRHKIVVLGGSMIFVTTVLFHIRNFALPVYSTIFEFTGIM